MAKKSLKVKQQQENITDVKYVEDHMLTSENLEFAVYALEN